MNEMTNSEYFFSRYFKAYGYIIKQSLYKNPDVFEMGFQYTECRYMDLALHLRPVLNHIMIELELESLDKALDEVVSQYRFKSPFSDGEKAYERIKMITPEDPRVKLIREEYSKDRKCVRFFYKKDKAKAILEDIKPLMQELKDCIQSGNALDYLNLNEIEQAIEALDEKDPA